MARLLLIDDDRDFRETLAVVLTSAGHLVTQAADGRQAVAPSDVDLVITDLVMPDKDGLESIDALHRSKPNLPIIAISGHGSDSNGYLKMATMLGAKRVFIKPFNPDSLIRVIDELLARPRGSSAPPQ
jgi:DNA-binding response OmpR family regulator